MIFSVCVTYFINMSKILDKIFWVRVNEPNSIKAILFNKLFILS
jgi:hypothetical protein